MSIKFIDELTPGTAYAVIDRKKDQFTVDDAKGEITGTISKTLLFVEDKTTMSPYVHTTIKRRFLFEDSSGDPVSLQKTHGLIFIEANMLPPPPSPATPPSPSAAASTGGAPTPVIARRQRRGVHRS